MIRDCVVRSLSIFTQGGNQHRCFVCCFQAQTKVERVPSTKSRMEDFLPFDEGLKNSKRRSPCFRRLHWCFVEGGALATKLPIRLKPPADKWLKLPNFQLVRSIVYLLSPPGFRGSLSGFPTFPSFGPPTAAVSMDTSMLINFWRGNPVSSVAHWSFRQAADASVQALPR